ncbi:MAG: bifunctional DNA primase/polymerase [Candidatus Dormibacteraeota bacterium]|nr:bifunctional DNA primase/polymerase [Candidatus Dormibacteraeota bacterium]
MNGSRDTLLLNSALAAHAAGLSLMPPKEDGSKAPGGQWAEYQRRLPSVDEIHRWYDSGRSGLGLVCGAVSGNLEMMEFEGGAVSDGLPEQFRERAEQVGLGELLARVGAGYCERTPSGGYHLLYRCSGPIEGSLKLARRRSGTEVQVLIETRGEGGYVVVAPSGGHVHPSGERWELLRGGLEQIVTINPAEREALLDLARSFDELRRAGADESQPDGKDGQRPGDDFNVRARWEDVLEPHGWTKLFTARDGNQHWRRPGKALGASATVSPEGDHFYVFTTSTSFGSERAYTKFHAYAILNHAGDFAAAARGWASRDTDGSP